MLAKHLLKKSLSQTYKPALRVTSHGSCALLMTPKRNMSVNDLTRHYISRKATLNMIIEMNK
jgi:hypothetical protein